MAIIYKPIDEVEYIGKYIVCETGDLRDLHSDINYCGNDAASHGGVSKYEGMTILAKTYFDDSTGVTRTRYVMYVATGSEPESPWQAISAEATYPFHYIKPIDVG